jgi:hypothetical protein
VFLAWKKMDAIIAGSKIANVVSAITTALKGPQTIFDALKGGNAASSALVFMFPTLTKIINFFRTAATAVAGFVGGLTAGPILLVAGILAAIVSVGVFLSRNWEEVTAAVKGFFKTNIVPKLESIKKSWNKMKDAVSSMLPPAVLQWFKDAGIGFNNGSSFQNFLKHALADARSSMSSSEISRSSSATSAL